jgi:hypothetical protein
MSLTLLLDLALAVGSSFATTRIYIPKLKGTVKDPRRAFEIQHAVAKLLSDGKLSPVTFEPIYEGLDSVSRGLGDIETRKTWGKAVVRVRNEQGDVILAKQPGERAKL